MELRDYARIIYKRKAIIVTVVLSAVITAAFLTIILPPIYKVETTLFFPIPANNVSKQSIMPSSSGVQPSSTFLPLNTETILQPLLGLLDSRKVAEYVLKKMPDQTISKIRSNVTVDIDVKTGLIEVVGYNKKPEIAAQLSTTYADACNKIFRGFSTEMTKEFRLFLEDQLADVQKKLYVAEEDLRVFKESHKTVMMDEETKNAIETDADLESEIRLKKIELDGIDAKTGEIGDQLSRQMKMELSAQVVTDNPVVRQLNSQLADLEIQFAAANVRYKENHPTITRLKTQIQATKNGISKEIARVVSSQTEGLNPLYENLRQQYSNLLSDKHFSEASLEGLKFAREEMQDRLSKLPGLSCDLVRLERDVTVYTQLVEGLMVQLENTKAQEVVETQSFIIVDRAEIPPKPAFPIMRVNLIVAIGFSIIWGILFVFLLEYIENRAGSKR